MKYNLKFIKVRHENKKREKFEGLKNNSYLLSYLRICLFIYLKS